ncbi:hypothetical protein [Pseudolactococcus laudensis]|uniref:hypothetical protein n=1 Tax=Pseudolactococcus laudensis TaxID=1494461 RepID=UPI002FCC82AB
MKLVSVLNELPIVGIQEGKVIGITSKVFVSTETRRVKYLIFKAPLKTYEKRYNRLKIS